MITFILGALATIVVGVMVWLTVSTIGMISKVKHLETQQEFLYREINERCNAINHQLDHLIQETNHRIDENYSYTDSRMDKLETKLTKK
jgi:CHASE1-domain containing sensor protein